MKYKSAMWTSLAVAGMVILIFDSKLVVIGATEGVSVCLNVVIPSLLPYFIFSNFLTASLQGKGSLLLIGLLGGYPAGAQAVKTAYDLGQCTEKEASRMLAYCNNAGPAFIFGMLAQLFEQSYIPWVLWGIHIISSLAVCCIFTGNREMPSVQANTKSISPSEAVQRSINAISTVCCWVFLFKIFQNMLDKRLLFSLPPILKTGINGLMELTNGCYGLSEIPSEALRFIFVSGFLGFGGLCVMMQTASIAKGLDIKKYILGKCLHCIISTLIALLLAPILLKF